ncbi:hypothetical protein [Streptomyces albipurpureus]|uniref:hypothetical protein n=1 Tax=Streptomyces albipurpureus TaxID=2897419 RepID=UPI002034892C|nr:hypothetical protein [Streptomyces sp. CWNU-1]
MAHPVECLAILAPVEKPSRHTVRHTSAVREKARISQSTQSTQSTQYGSTWFLMAAWTRSSPKEHPAGNGTAGAAPDSSNVSSPVTPI